MIRTNPARSEERVMRFQWVLWLLQRFKSIKVIPSVFTLLLLTLFVYLGMWQLDRATEKRIEEATLLEREASPSISLKAALALPLNTLVFRPVDITGKFLEETYVLLDNQILEGQPGYQVFSVFKPSLKGTPYLLVNRGWIQAGTSRKDWPSIKTPTGEVRLQGSFRTPFKSWVLNHDYRIESHPAFPALDASKSSPSSHSPYSSHPSKPMARILRVQDLELSMLNQQFNQEFFPLVFRLSPKTPYTFETFSERHPFPYQKHLGYAWQWFTMGGLVVIYFLVITFRANKHVST